MTNEINKATIKTYDGQYLKKLQKFLNKTKRKSYRLFQPSQSDVILDVGCGIGHDVIELAKSGAIVYGVDNDSNFIAEAQLQPIDDLKVHFLCSDAERIPLDDNSTTKVRYERVLQHIENHDVILKEAYRLLRKGGQIQIIDSEYLSWSLFLENEKLERKIFDTIAYERVKGACLIRRLPSTLQRHGFKVTLKEVDNYIVKDYNFANYITRFDKIVTQEFANGRFSKREFKLWQGLNKDLFNLSMNILIIMATKE